ncbi:MAG: zinc ABC transporter substrate-binding protein [Anaerolineae bacterium]|nr:MAG: zinc ABC transporter substrate-binding protein [Anaerolineae bacterium]
MKVKLHGNRVLITAIIATLLAVTGSNCQSTPSPKSEHEMAELSAVTLGVGEKLQVATTTNVLADVVAIVGGDRIALTTLMGVGVDPHSYVPTPADVAAVHNAHVVFASGAGLETNLEEILASAGGEAARIYVSQGLKLRLAPDESSSEEEAAAHDHKGGDPHVWFSVPNVIAWVGTIEGTLSALDPANAAAYAVNARAYVEELESLDAWVMAQVATIPETNRRLVTNHPAFGYLADRYGLDLVGAVYPVSPSSEPSAQDLAALEEAIRAYGVPAVFTESTVNPRLAEQMAQDTGVRLVPLYTGSLGGPGSGVESYVELMRYDVEAIVGALK